MDDALLSQRLFASISQDFFRPLGRPSAAVYVDCADRLVNAAAEAGRLPNAEAMAIIREVLTLHPGAPLEDDEGAALRDSRQKAGAFFNRLTAAGWIEDQTLGLHDRWTLISPGLRPLLKLARDLAESEMAELKTFADTVRGVCETLEREDALDPLLCTPEQMRSRVTDLNARLESAVIQLHGVEKLISIFDQRQRGSETPAETLRLLYAEFGSGQHMVCYDALRRGGLLPRLQTLRSLVADRRDHPMAKERLAEGYVEYYACDAAEAYARAEKAWRELEHRLGAIRLVADAIDARMAAFNQLSQQRYKYQTEMRGRRPEIVKQYCDLINARHAGMRMSALESVAPDFEPLLPEMRFYFGLESLARARRARNPVDLTFDQGRPKDRSEEEVLAALRERQRLALTPQRAARLMARLLPERGQRAETNALTTATIDEMLDLLAIAAYNQAPAPGGRTYRWTVDGARRLAGLNPETVALDEQAGWRMERFGITRNA